MVEKLGENLLWVVSPTFFARGAGGGDGSERPRRGPIRSYKGNARHCIQPKDILLYGCYSLNNEQHIS
jgi:hypothetical protein